ncbi:MAG: hypothetical protein MMC33_009932 [Icmadophila ericetorum]|nr:hypothetical protein [Icmadophila ericetorum]
MSATLAPAVHLRGGDDKGCFGCCGGDIHEEQPCVEHHHVDASGQHHHGSWSGPAHKCKSCTAPSGVGHNIPEAEKKIQNQGIPMNTLVAGNGDGGLGGYTNQSNEPFTTEQNNEQSTTEQSTTEQYTEDGAGPYGGHAKNTEASTGADNMTGNDNELPERARSLLSL